MLTPNELIHALLLAPVDLLWNGGIGTYVKARAERPPRSATIGRRGRVDAEDLRCRVVGEGGNLGFAARPGRLRARRRRIDGCDRQLRRGRLLGSRVNIKILLDSIVAEGDTDREAAERAPRRDGRRGRGARPPRQLRAGPGAVDVRCPGRLDGRGAPALHPQPRAGRRAEPRARGAADDETLDEREAAGRA